MRVLNIGTVRKNIHVPTWFQMPSPNRGSAPYSVITRGATTSALWECRVSFRLLLRSGGRGLDLDWLWIRRLRRRLHYLQMYHHFDGLDAGVGGYNLYTP